MQRIYVCNVAEQEPLVAPPVCTGKREKKDANNTGRADAETKKVTPLETPKW